MNGVLERTLGILELLAQHGEGMEMAAIADQLDIPRSAVHRLLADLTRCGYVRQTRDHGDYLLTTKLVSMGLSFLSKSGIVDIAQPLLDRLAEISGELVRLSVVDGNRLTWVARAQGARQGLRYDPDMGSDAQLSCSSSGHAW
ncbi:MAG: helix-turn-helix domain-containing protein, partial [Polaromonas sp.]